MIGRGWYVVPKQVLQVSVKTLAWDVFNFVSFDVYQSLVGISGTREIQKINLKTILMISNKK